VRTAYRKRVAAENLHPDQGGDAVRFAAITGQMDVALSYAQAKMREARAAEPPPKKPREPVHPDQQILHRRRTSPRMNAPIFPRRGASRVPLLDYANPEDMRLIDLAKAGDRGAATRLVILHDRVLRSVARAAMRPGLLYDDLFQWARLGFLRAIERFDLNGGASLATYGKVVALAFVRRKIRETESPIVVPGQVHDRLVKAHKHQLPLPPELDEARRLLSCARLEQPLTAETGSATLGEVLSNDLPGAEEQLADAQDEARRRELVLQALELLPTRQRWMLERRVMAETPMAMAELGAAYGITGARAQKIVQEALIALSRNVISLASPSERAEFATWGRRGIAPKTPTMRVKTPGHSKKTPSEDTLNQFTHYSSPGTQ
jgi:RNA polymerase sigma-32 factor